MQLAEQCVIARNNSRLAVIAAASFKSKNLYNAANYEIRQAFSKAEGVAGHVVYPLWLAINL